MPRWLLWTAAAVLAWGVWAVLGKLIGGRLTDAQSQALSTLGFLPVMLALPLARKRLVRTGRRVGYYYALAAGAVSCLGNLPFYDLLSRGAKAAAVVPLTSLAPIVTVLLALMFLRERLNRVQVLGVGLSVAALLMFNVTDESREGGVFLGPLAYAFVPIVLWGLAGFLQKLAAGDLSGELAALLVLSGFVLVSGVLFVTEPMPAEVSLELLGVTAALGLTLAFGNYAVVVAYTTGKASVITPLAGLYPLVSVPLAMLVFDETIGVREGVAIGCAVLAVAALSFETPSKPSEPEA